jgi:hypothetical protein
VLATLLPGEPYDLVAIAPNVHLVAETELAVCLDLGRPRFVVEEDQLIAAGRTSPPWGDVFVGTRGSAYPQ